MVSRAKFPFLLTDVKRCSVVLERATRLISCGPFNGPGLGLSIPTFPLPLPSSPDQRCTLWCLLYYPSSKLWPCLLSFKSRLSRESFQDGGQLLTRMGLSDQVTSKIYSALRKNPMEDDSEGNTPIIK